MENTITMKVNGMSCSHCVRAVEEAVNSLEGIFSVNVELEEKQATVVFDDRIVSLDDIRQAVEDEGYDVE